MKREILTYLTISLLIVLFVFWGCSTEGQSNKMDTQKLKTSKIQKANSTTSKLRQDASHPLSILELPDDIKDYAVAWIEPGRPPTFDSLSIEDLRKLNDWLEKKQKIMKPNEIMVIYKDITYHKSKAPTVQVYQPPYFSGKAVRGGPDQELTDGRLTMIVTQVDKTSYQNWGGPSPKFPFQSAYRQKSMRP